MIPFIVLFAGLLFVFLEFYTPGGFFAVLGAIAIIFANLSYIIHSDSMMLSFIFVSFSLLSLAIVIWFALRLIQKSGDRNTFFLAQDQEGYQGASFDEHVIGKEAETITDLGPSGFILFEGKRYPARSRGVYIDRGIRVLVIGGEGAHLIVKEI